MKRVINFLCMALLCLLVSCNNDEFIIDDYIDNNEEYVDNYYYEENYIDYSWEEDNKIRIPFVENMGVKIVKCTINESIGVDMVFDSGCSFTLITIAEAQYLFDKGVLSMEDKLGDSYSVIADGSIDENMIFNIKSLEIDDQIIFHNVKVCVTANANAPLLLGNEILDRMASYTVDNQNNEIIFHLN